jgi:hypothetical protein
MERSTILKFGKPSISMGHLYHGYVSHNQMEKKKHLQADSDVLKGCAWAQTVCQDQERQQNETCQFLATDDH